MGEAQPGGQDTPVDVVGKRLTVIGVIGVAVTGLLWITQKSSHDDGQAILSAVRDPDPFNSTPYAVALGVAVVVLVLGLVLSNTRR